MLPLVRHTDGVQIDRSLKGLEKVTTSCQMVRSRPFTIAGAVSHAMQLRVSRLKLTQTDAIMLHAERYIAVF